MLDYAYFHQSALFECLKQTINNKDLYFYLMFPYKYFSFEIAENNRNSIQYVSLSPDNEVVGFLAAYTDNANNIIYNMDFINFTGRTNIYFSKDIKLFFDEIFLTRNYRKILFNCILDNPAIKMYRKLVKKLDGKEVGIFKANKKLTDGKYYDEVIFEIYRDGYISSQKVNTNS